MKRQTMTAAAAACMLGTISVNAALINGDFESGMSGWSETLEFASVTSVQNHTLLGQFALQLGAESEGNGAARQDVALTGGVLYQLTFWYMQDPDQPGALSFTIGSTTVPAINPTGTWQKYTYFYTPAASGSAKVQFNWADTASYAFIDDVSLTPIPEPTTMLAGALLLLPFGAGILRSRKSKVA